MLRKLLKHELRATSRWMLPMFALVLAVSVLMRLFGLSFLDANNGVLNTIGVILIVIFVFSIMGVCILAFALMLYRFWKNLLSDEGYVMMTLPVSVHRHIWSKLLLTALWYILTVAVLIAALFIMTFNIEEIMESVRLVLGLFTDFQQNWKIWEAVLTLAEGGLILLLGALLVTLWIWAAMAIGHSFANRKSLFSVLAFFAMEMAMQIAGGIIDGILPDGLTYGLEHTVVLAIIMAAELAVAAVFYFITAYFLKKRLNLE